MHSQPVYTEPLLARARARALSLSLTRFLSVILTVRLEHGTSFFNPMWDKLNVDLFYGWEQFLSRSFSGSNSCNVLSVPE